VATCSCVLSAQHAATTLRALGVKVARCGRETTSIELINACDEVASFRAVLQQCCPTEHATEQATEHEAPRIRPRVGDVQHAGEGTSQSTSRARSGTEGVHLAKESVPCPFLHLGKCSSGKRCKFAHAGDEATWARIPCRNGGMGPHGRVCAAKGQCVYPDALTAAADLLLSEH
jgi:hypothetical protein